ncbi:MAG: hypothetical protein JNL39_16205 [Opitutaceae bacterium]|nr:hypothetical protein [Opitutaceae bacterium]
MKSLLKITAALVAGTALSASAATFNFEGTSVVSGITSLVQSDSGLTATFTRVGGLAFEIRSDFPAFGTRTLSPFNNTSAGAFIVDFSALISSFSVDMGDFAVSDVDTLTLTAYAGAGGTGAVLGTTSLTLPNSPAGFHSLTLALSSASIASVVMNGGSTAFPNSVAYDNIVATVGPVGAPDAGSTAVLLFAALAGLGVLRRRMV